MSITIESLIESFFILVAGWFVVSVIGKRINLRSMRIAQLYLWHSFFGVVYAVTVVSIGGDATQYYEDALTNDSEFAPGASAVTALAEIPAAHLGLSFLATSLSFSILGCIGLILFDSALKSTVRTKTRLTQKMASMIVLLPSLNFWSSGLGKDSLAFLAVSSILWSLQRISARSFVLVCGCLILFCVRPHILAFLVLALVATTVLDRKSSFLSKSTIYAVTILCGYSLVPLAAKYVGLDDPSSISTINEYISTRQGLNLGGGSSLDISTMSLPAVVFSYMYRPLFFDAHNSLALASSFDNGILLLLSIGYLISALNKKKRNYRINKTALLFGYSALVWMGTALTTANLGIAVRQKWMFVPALLLLYFDSRRDRHPDIAQINRPRSNSLTQ
ncbi:MAG: hypothetical protein GY930_02450 [bacterium]|nr:hypothetical protein [bacterium]